MSHKPPKVGYEDITPEQAEEDLRNMRQNRPLKELFLAYLIRAINADQFNGENGSPVRYDTEGRLCDGQHRFTAIKITGKTQRMLVVRGITDDALKTVDIGVTRSLGDQLRIERGDKNANQRIAAVGLCARLLTGQVVPLRLSDQYDEWLKVFKPGIEMLDEENFFNTPHTRNAPVAGPLAFAYRANPEIIRKLAVQARDGLGLNATDVARVVRDYLLRHRDGENMMDGAKKILAACKAVVENRTLAKLQASDQAVDFFREFYDKGAAKKLAEFYADARSEASSHVARVARRNRADRAA